MRPGRCESARGGVVEVAHHAWPELAEQPDRLEIDALVVAVEPRPEVGHVDVGREDPRAVDHRAERIDQGLVAPLPRLQLAGSQLTSTSTLAGNDVATFPDYPAEIRAPAGTTFGVSAFQINFSALEVLTAGDAPFERDLDRRRAPAVAVRKRIDR